MLQVQAQLKTKPDANIKKPVKKPVTCSCRVRLCCLMMHCMQLTSKSCHAALQGRRFWGLDDDGTFWNWDRAAWIEWFLFYGYVSIGFVILYFLV